MTHETEWARSRPSNVQHGQDRPWPISPARAVWTTIAAVPVVFVAVYVIVRIFGSGAW